MNAGLCIIGASGHGRDCLDVALDCGYTDIVFVDGAPETRSVPDFIVLEDRPETIAALRAERRKFHIAVGDPQIRSEIAARLDGYPFANLIHPGAVFGRGMREVADRSQGLCIAAFAQIGNAVTLGQHCLIGRCAGIGHDCSLADFATIMPGAMVGGNVSLGRRALVGANATILQGSNNQKRLIGKDAKVGAASLVIRDVPDGTTVMAPLPRFLGPVATDEV